MSLEAFWPRADTQMRRDDFGSLYEACLRLAGIIYGAYAIRLV